MKKILILIAMMVSGLALSSCSIDEDDSAASYEDNMKKGQEYLAENSKHEGIITTESGLQYEVLKEGDGKSPTITSVVKCHYEGRLIDGTVFDSSYNRGAPAEFVLNQLIYGWIEGMQLMKEGSKYRFYIPYYLAYGSQSAGIILPYSALIFDIELIEVKN